MQGAATEKAGSPHELFLSFKMTSCLSKLIKSIQILQLKKDQKFLLFSLSFSECFHLYSRKPTSTKFPSDVQNIFVQSEYGQLHYVLYMVGQIFCVQNILVLGQLGPMLFCPKMVVNHILGTIFGSVFHFWNTFWLFEEPLRIFLRGPIENHKWVFHFLEYADKCIKLTSIFFLFFL